MRFLKALLVTIGIVVGLITFAAMIMALYWILYFCNWILYIGVFVIIIFLLFYNNNGDDKKDGK